MTEKPSPTVSTLPDAVNKATEVLRQVLIENGMTFAALYVGLINRPGSVLICADNMPNDIRMDMLRDLLESTQQALDYYEGTQ